MRRSEHAERLVIAAVAAAVGFGGGALYAHAKWVLPCEREFARYANRCERMVMSAEAERYVLWLAKATAEYARQHGRMPPAAPRTPAITPRGIAVDIRPEVWREPGWAALHFRPPPRSRFSYELVTKGGAFTARAVGDLDADGVTSLYERAGELEPDGGLTESKGIYVRSGLE